MSEIHKHSIKKDFQYSEKSIESVSDLFSALGDPSRIKLLFYLSKGETCVSELAEFCGEGQSTVSHRLKLLKNNRIVERRREGKHIYYSLTDEHILSLIDNAFQHIEENK